MSLIDLAKYYKLTLKKSPRIDQSDENNILSSGVVGTFFLKFHQMIYIHLYISEMTMCFCKKRGIFSIQTIVVK